MCIERFICLDIILTYYTEALFRYVNIQINMIIA